MPPQFQPGYRGKHRSDRPGRGWPPPCAPWGSRRKGCGTHRLAQRVLRPPDPTLRQPSPPRALAPGLWIGVICLLVGVDKPGCGIPSPGAPISAFHLQEVLLHVPGDLSVLQGCRRDTGASAEPPGLSRPFAGHSACGRELGREEYGDSGYPAGCAVDGGVGDARGER